MIFISSGRDTVVLLLNYWPILAAYLATGCISEKFPKLFIISSLYILAEPEENIQHDPARSCEELQLSNSYFRSIILTPLASYDLKYTSQIYYKFFRTVRFSSSQWTLMKWSLTLPYILNTLLLNSGSLTSYKIPLGVKDNLRM
jgi:hypothetical protein